MPDTTFEQLLELYREIAAVAQQQNPDSDHLEQMMKAHIRQLIREGKGGEILDGYRGVPGNKITGCPPGYVCCSDGSCQPIIVGCYSMRPAA